MKHNYYLSLGSNLGDRADYFKQAHQGLAKLGVIDQESTVVETEPFGVADHVFLNQVIKLTSELEPTILLDAIKDLEKAIGRQPREHWGNREIDIDIILWDKKKLDTVTPQGNQLRIPHPGLLSRQFLLDALKELGVELNEIL